MEDLKDQVAHDELTHSTAGVNIYQPESRLSKYIPGGYSSTRCLPLRGRAMMYAVLSLAGTAILFFGMYLPKVPPETPGDVFGLTHAMSMPGYDASVMSQVNTNKNYLRHMGAAAGTNRDAAAIGGIVSIWYGGFAIGALMVGSYADRIGRLKTIELGCLWGLVGAALQCTAQNITWMMFARIIGGIGCGHLNTVVPIWTSELADPHLRGAFVAVEFTLALSGSTMVYWMEYACTKLQTEAFAWRFPVGCELEIFLFTEIAEGVFCKFEADRLFSSNGVSPPCPRCRPLLSRISPPPGQTGQADGGAGHP